MPPFEKMSGWEYFPSLQKGIHRASVTWMYPNSFLLSSANE